jgi:hypothetical protein
MDGEAKPHRKEVRTTMALQASNPFATFDFSTTGLLQLEISPMLEEALYYDLHLMGALQRKGAVEMDNPYGDIIYYWDEDALNTDTVTVSGSVASGGTSIVVNAGQGVRVHVGDILMDTATGTTEKVEVTAISTDTLTVTRGLNSTTAATIATAAVLQVIRSEQESSDIGSDRSVVPTVRQGYTQIFAGAYDLQISGSQLARKTIAAKQLQDQVAHQLANRMIEFKIGLTRAVCYAPLAGPGSDTAYRRMGSLDYWITTGGGVVTTSVSTLNASAINTANNTLVLRGGSPDLLAANPSLAGSLAGIDSSNRRMLESEVKVGSYVQEVVTNQGNTVEIVLDNRLITGDAFLLQSDKIHVRPYADRGMFVIAATDFADARKRRVLGEWGFELHNPSLHARLTGCT